MTFTDRFYGRGNPRAGKGPVANPRLQNPPSLQLLFPNRLELDEAVLTGHVRALHRDLAGATVELFRVPPPMDNVYTQGHPGATVGLVAWGPHVVKLVALNTIMPRDALERSLEPAHYDESIKQAAYRHLAHVMLFYAGYHPDPVEQFAVLTAVAAGVARYGAIVVTNEEAHTSAPAAMILPNPAVQADYLNALRALPIPFLFAGFVKLEVQDRPGVWMRTCGCPILGLPDLALHASGHDQGMAAFELFGNMLAYLRQSGARFGPGHTMRVGDGDYYVLRTPTAAEPFLDSGGQMFVVEPAVGVEEPG